MGLGAGDAAGCVAVAPVDGDAGSADREPYGLVVVGGGPSSDKGVVGGVKEGVDGLGSSDLDDLVVAAAEEVESSSSDVDLVGGAGGDALAGLEPEGRAVDHLEEVCVCAGDTVGGVVTGKYMVLRCDVADRSPIVGDGQVVQGDVPGPQVLIEHVGSVEHPRHAGHR